VSAGRVLLSVVALKGTAVRLNVESPELRAYLLPNVPATLLGQRPPVPSCAAIWPQPRLLSSLAPDVDPGRDLRIIGSGSLR
jgi:hypothetical protein